MFFFSRPLIIISLFIQIPNSSSRPNALCSPSSYSLRCTISKLFCPNEKNPKITSVYLKSKVHLELNLTCLNHAYPNLEKIGCSGRLTCPDASREEVSNLGCKCPGTFSVLPASVPIQTVTIFLMYIVRKKKLFL